MLSVSVIIPTKNRPEFLKRALYSVLNQTYKVSEIIIVDDFSDFQEYSFITDARVKLIRNTSSLGGALSRNIGVDNSTSDLIMFLDDDDAWDVRKVEDQIKLFNDEEVGIVFSGKQVVYDTNLNLPVRNIIPNIKQINFSALCECNYIGSTSSVALRRVDFLRVSGFDDNLKCFQDYDLWLRICKDKKAVFDSKCNVYYTVFRKEGMQISRAIDGRHIVAGHYLINKYEKEMSHSELKMFKMNINQLISKALNFSDPKKAIYFSIKSILVKPSIRGFKFFLASLASSLGYKHG
ncbi:glycosyltransferase family 2 protein [Photobacterium leiognathi subsp. mandapamensis]|uniref:glycosyltransferase family 2 protein n=1 Tax=Photobacterium leiognathi TaxID=553611 RepID=UPI003BF5C09A